MSLPLVSCTGNEMLMFRLLRCGKIFTGSDIFIANYPCTSERIWQIDRHLAKIWTNDNWQNGTFSEIWCL